MNCKILGEKNGTEKKLKKKGRKKSMRREWWRLPKNGECCIMFEERMSAKKENTENKTEKKKIKNNLDKEESKYFTGLKK